VRYAECHYADFHYAECHYAECRYGECRYAECRYAEWPQNMRFGCLFLLFLTQPTLWEPPNKSVLHYSKLEMLVRDKHSSLLDPFVSYTRMKCCEYRPSGLYHKTYYGCNLQFP
jgi:hypothetical protein